MKIDVRPSPNHRFGVFARKRIRKGERIGAVRGRRTCEEGPHVLWVRHDDGWRGFHGLGRLRYLNHHSLPSAEFYGPELYALRSIAPGEEVTIDYGEDVAGAA